MFLTAEQDESGAATRVIHSLDAGSNSKCIRRYARSLGVDRTTPYGYFVADEDPPSQAQEAPS